MVGHADFSPVSLRGSSSRCPRALPEASIQGIQPITIKLGKCWYGTGAILFVVGYAICVYKANQPQITSLLNHGQWRNVKLDFPEMLFTA